VKYTVYKKLHSSCLSYEIATIIKDSGLTLVICKVSPILQEVYLNLFELLGNSPFQIFSKNVAKKFDTQVFQYNLLNHSLMTSNLYILPLICLGIHIIAPTTYTVEDKSDPGILTFSEMLSFLESRSFEA